MNTSVPGQVGGVCDLRNRARQAWAAPDPSEKCRQVQGLWADVIALPSGECDDAEDHPLQMQAIALDHLQPGTPTRPTLVHPSKLAKRATAHAAGRAALLHAIAHIEFNAINLALDAIWRYPDMPNRFATDWLSVAADEARHFQMLVDELATGGTAYGDHVAHDGLWEMARKTAPDLQARMALVPRVLEARGLDATPQIQKKLQAAGDRRAIDLLQVILDDEIGHVRIGDAWFRRICRQLGDDATDAYRKLISRFRAPWPKGPLNRHGRLAAGFTEEELQWLQTKR